MKIGIVGAGFMGSMHARMLSDIDSVELSGIAGKTEMRLKSIAKELNIQCMTHWEKLLNDTSIQVIDICAPTEFHAEIAIKAMEAGKHVIIEYPVCHSKQELLNLHSMSIKYNRVCAVAYYSRYQSHYSYVFNQAKSGNLGKINGLFISRKSTDYFNSHDIVNNLISQDIDFMVRLLGLPKTSVCKNSHQHYALFIFQYTDFYVIIEGSTQMHPGFPFTTRHTISGTKGSIDLLWQYTDHPSAAMMHADGDGQRQVTVKDYDPYAFELNHIIRGIQHNKDVASFSIQSVLESASLAFECRDKLASGQEK